MEPKRKKPDNDDAKQVEISSPSSTEEQDNQSIQKTESKSKKPRISSYSNSQEGVNKDTPIVYGSKGVSVEKMMKNKRAGYPNNFRAQKQPAVLQEEMISDYKADDDLNIQETKQELSPKKKKHDNSEEAAELKRKKLVYRTASSHARGIQGARMMRNKAPYTSLRIRAQNDPGVLQEETISDHAAIYDDKEDDDDLKVEETKQELNPNKKKRDIDTQSESSPVVKSNRSKKPRIFSVLTPQDVDDDDDPVIPGESLLARSFYRALKLQAAQNSSMASPGINEDDLPENDLPNSPLVPEDNSEDNNVSGEDST